VKRNTRLEWANKWLGFLNMLALKSTWLNIVDKGTNFRTEVESDFNDRFNEIITKGGNREFANSNQYSFWWKG